MDTTKRLTNVHLCIIGVSAVILFGVSAGLNIKFLIVSNWLTVACTLIAVFIESHTEYKERPDRVY